MRTENEIKKDIKRINDNWLKKEKVAPPKANHPWKLDIARQVKLKKNERYGET